MDSYLVVVGCQESKLSQISKKARDKIMDYVFANAHTFDGVISVIRVKGKGSENFQRSGDKLANEQIEYLPYESNEVIEVPGYTLDCRTFRRDARYVIVGVSTAASILGVAMSMYSNGLRIEVLKDYCADRQGDKFHDSAINIMNAYMPGVVK